MLQRITDIVHSLLLVAIIVSWIFLVGSFFVDVPLRGLGSDVGEYAIWLLWIVSIPGILKRFRVKGLLQDVQIILMKSRRRIGDLMFTFVVMHFAWLRLFRYIRTQSYPSIADLPAFEIVGLVSLFLFIPLFITSNNFSVRLLKKNWQRIHYLIYISVYFAALHVALIGESLYAAGTFTVAFLQAASWIYWKKVPA